MWWEAKISFFDQNLYMLKVIDPFQGVFDEEYINSCRPVLPGAVLCRSYCRSGRKAGAVNKTTKDARIAIASFVDGNAERLNELLDRIAEDNPKAAFLKR